MQNDGSILTFSHKPYITFHNIALGFPDNLETVHTRNFAVVTTSIYKGRRTEEVHQHSFTSKSKYTRIGSQSVGLLLKHNNLSYLLIF
jgi:hypothetical protein